MIAMKTIKYNKNITEIGSQVRHLWKNWIFKMRYEWWKSRTFQKKKQKEVGATGKQNNITVVKAWDPEETRRELGSDRPLLSQLRN